MNPGIDQEIVPIVLVPQTLLAPATKEVIVETVSGGVWVNMTLKQVRQKGVDRINPGDICHAVSVVEPTSPDLIGTVSTSPPYGLNAIQKVANKWQSNSHGLVGHTPKLDAVVDGKLPNDLDSASIFSKVIVHKISDGSSGDLYLRCRMNFADDPVQTQIPQFMGS